MSYSVTYEEKFDDLVEGLDLNSGRAVAALEEMTDLEYESALIDIPKRSAEAIIADLDEWWEERRDEAPYPYLNLTISGIPYVGNV